MPTGPVRWDLSSLSPTYTDEGTPITLQLRVYNPIIGVSIQVQATGNMAGDANWNEGWDATWTATCASVGATYTRIANSYGTITLGSSFTGAPLTFTRTSALDNRTEGELQYNVIVINQSQGVIKRGTVSRWIRDTSTTPPGTPTFRLRRISPTGSSLDEGTALRVRLQTENMVAGTTLRIYAANTANLVADWTASFRSVVGAAVTAAGCSWDTSIGVTDGVNGGQITFNSGYNDAAPIEFVWTSREDALTESDLEQVDIIVDRVSNPAILVYASVVSAWIRDTSRAPTPTYWQIEMLPPRPVAGQVVAYRLFSDTGVSAASVTIATDGTAADGDFTSGFHAALQTAADTDPFVSYDGAGTVTVTAGWSGSFTWTRTVAAGFTGRKTHTVRLSSPTDASLIVASDAALFMGGVTLPAEPAYVTGCNLSGGEFSPGSVGVYGTDYRYGGAFSTVPRQREIDYHFTKREGVIRLPFTWERVQRTLGGVLYERAGWNGTDFSAGAGGALDMNYIDVIVAYATARGMIVVLDVHNYARYKIVSPSSNNLIAPETNPTPLQFYDLWERLANRYKTNPLVWFGMMNEPLPGLNAQEWKRIAQGCVNAIRARTGALNRILVPGTNYTGAHSWLSSGNADAFVGFYDPASNFDFEMHQYLDADSAGDDTFCSTNSGYRLRAATDWCREYGFTAFLGEFAAPDPTVAGSEQCATELPNLLSFMSLNRDVWRGWTVWGGGARWNSTYIFRLDPPDYLAPVDTEIMKRIEPYFYDGGDS